MLILSSYVASHGFIVAQKYRASYGLHYLIGLMNDDLRQGIPVHFRGYDLTHMEGVLIPAEPVPDDPIISSSVCRASSWTVFAGNSHFGFLYHRSVLSAFHHLFCDG